MSEFWNVCQNSVEASLQTSILRAFTGSSRYASWYFSGRVGFVILMYLLRVCILSGCDLYKHYKYADEESDKLFIVKRYLVLVLRHLHKQIYINYKNYNLDEYIQSKHVLIRLIRYIQSLKEECKQMEQHGVKVDAKPFRKRYKCRIDKEYGNFTKWRNIIKYRQNPIKQDKESYIDPYHGEFSYLLESSCVSCFIRFIVEFTVSAPLVIIQALIHIHGIHKILHSQVFLSNSILMSARILYKITGNLPDSDDVILLHTIFSTFIGCIMAQSLVCILFSHKSITKKIENFCSLIEFKVITIYYNSAKKELDKKFDERPNNRSVVEAIQF